MEQKEKLIAEQNEVLAVSVGKAAAMMGVSKSLMYQQLLHESDFPKVKIGRKYIIPVDRLREYLAKKCEAVN